MRSPFAFAYRNSGPIPSRSSRLATNYCAIAAKSANGQPGHSLAPQGAVIRLPTRLPLCLPPPWKRVSQSGVAPVDFTRCGAAARSIGAGTEASCRCATPVETTGARATCNGPRKYARGRPNDRCRIKPRSLQLCVGLPTPHISCVCIADPVREAAASLFFVNCDAKASLRAVAERVVSRVACDACFPAHTQVTPKNAHKTQNLTCYCNLQNEEQL
jgi:hypothetical protein